MRALVTGATGFIGRYLVRKLNNPIVLTRDPRRAVEVLGPDVQPMVWNAEQPPPLDAFDAVDCVYNLAGESVLGIWTRRKKHAIRASRVQGTHQLVRRLMERPYKPTVLISASAVGYYGNRQDQILTEEAAPGTGFLADVCRDWEDQAMAARDAGIRVVIPRFGIVLGPDGGAFPRMVRPFRYYLGGPLGTGRQWMSWIHIDDLIELLLFIARHNQISGPVNATSPHPVTQREFARTLGRVLHRPAILRVPTMAIEAVLGEAAGEILSSQRAIPGRPERHGFHFQFPILFDALSDIVHRCRF